MMDTDLDMTFAANMAATVLERRLRDGEPIGDLENCVATLLAWRKQAIALIEELQTEVT